MMSALKENSIHQLIFQVLQSPDAVAVIFENEQLTYRELNKKANRLAHYLQTLGLSQRFWWEFVLSDCSKMVIALLGILKAGGAYVTLDQNYSSERLAFMLEDSHLSAILTTQNRHSFRHN